MSRTGGDVRIKIFFNLGKWKATSVISTLIFTKKELNINIEGFNFQFQLYEGVIQQ